MPRGSVTRTRIFQWTGSDLTSTTNPENGTVTYTDDGAHHVLTRTDAKTNVTQCTYDIYGRLTLTQHLFFGTTEDLTQRETNYYDTVPAGTNPAGTETAFYNLPSGSGLYTIGRLAAMQFVNPNPAATQNAMSIQQLAYIYSYNTAGRVTMQDLRLVGGVPTGTMYDGEYSKSDCTEVRRFWRSPSAARCPFFAALWIARVLKPPRRRATSIVTARLNSGAWSRPGVPYSGQAAQRDSLWVLDR